MQCRHRFMMFEQLRQSLHPSEMSVRIALQLRQGNLYVGCTIGLQQLGFLQSATVPPASAYLGTLYGFIFHPELVTEVASEMCTQELPLWATSAVAGAENTEGVFRALDRDGLCGCVLENFSGAPLDRVHGTSEHALPTLVTLIHVPMVCHAGSIIPR